jgi:hypothetical protein
MSSIKVDRALRLSAIGDCPASAAAMLDAIPSAVVAALNSTQLAALIDANWHLAGASKAMAIADALTEGAVWDAKNNVMRGIQ